MPRRQGDDEEARILTNEARTKPLTDAAPPNAVRRFVSFLAALFVLLAVVISISPGEGEKDEPAKDDSQRTLTLAPTAVSAQLPIKEVSGDNDVAVPTAEEQEAEEDMVNQLLEELDALSGTAAPTASVKEAVDNDQDGKNTISDMTEDEAEALKRLIELGGEDMVENESGIPAQKPSGTLLEPAKRYLLYTPSGTWIEQEFELANAAQMAHALSRILLVPMFGTPTRAVSEYNNLARNHLSSVDQIYDLATLKQLVPAMALEESVVQVLSRARAIGGSDSVRYISTSSSYSGAAVVSKLIRDDRMVLFFSGVGMWSAWWPASSRTIARRHISYHPDIRKIALRLTRTTLGSEFYAVDPGQASSEDDLGTATSLQAFARSARYKAWKESIPVYLVGDHPSENQIIALVGRSKIITRADLIKSGEFDKYLTRFSDQSVGLMTLEKLVCVQSLDFWGTSASIIASQVRLMRLQKEFSFPEVPENG